MRVALELAQAFGGSLYVCSAFDVEYHHVVFHNIKDVLSLSSVQSLQVRRTGGAAQQHHRQGTAQAVPGEPETRRGHGPGVPGRVTHDTDPGGQTVPGDHAVGPRDQAVAPGAGAARGAPDRRHGAREFRQKNSCALPVQRAAHGDDGRAAGRTSPGSKKTASRDSRGHRTPRYGFFACRRSRRGIARRAVEEYLLEQTHGEPQQLSNKWSTRRSGALPTHMQLIMGIGTREGEIALAEVKAQEQMKATKVQGRDADPEPAGAEWSEVAPSRAREPPAAPPRPTRSCGARRRCSGCSSCPLIAGRSRVTAVERSPGGRHLA